MLAAYAILQHYQAPPFYDKLLCVPILNLMVRGLDRWSATFAARFHPLDLVRKWGPRKLNFSHMAMPPATFDPAPPDIRPARPTLRAFPRLPAASAGTCLVLYSRSRLK